MVTNIASHAAVTATLIAVLVRPAGADEADRLGLFVLDLESRQAEQVAEEPLPGHAYCGSPAWAPDGRRFAFDATPGKDWANTHVLIGDWPLRGGATFVDLGIGNCPAFSPDGGRIAFQLNRTTNPGDQPGLWIMQADGSRRKRLGASGIPMFSPDGKQVLSVSFGNPRRLALLDLADGTLRPIALADHTFLSIPSWVDATTLVAIVGGSGPPMIVLLDIAQPAQARVKQEIWIRGAGLNAEPEFPVYDPASKRCFFVGRGTQGSFLLGILVGFPDIPSFLETRQIDRNLQNLALSPDGKRLLFCSNRPADGLEN